MRKLLPLTIVAIAGSVVNIAMALLVPAFLPVTVALALVTAFVAIWLLRLKH